MLSGEPSKCSANTSPLPHPFPPVGGGWASSEGEEREFPGWLQENIAKLEIAAAGTVRAQRASRAVVLPHSWQCGMKAPEGSAKECLWILLDVEKRSGAKVIWSQNEKLGPLLPLFLHIRKQGWCLGAAPAFRPEPKLQDSAFAHEMLPISISSLKGFSLSISFDGDPGKMLIHPISLKLKCFSHQHLSQLSPTTFPTFPLEKESLRPWALEQVAPA